MFDLYNTLESYNIIDNDYAYEGKIFNDIKNFPKKIEKASDTELVRLYCNTFDDGPREFNGGLEIALKHAMEGDALFKELLKVQAKEKGYRKKFDYDNSKNKIKTKITYINTEIPDVKFAVMVFKSIIGTTKFYFFIYDELRCVTQKELVDRINSHMSPKDRRSIALFAQMQQQQIQQQQINMMQQQQQQNALMQMQMMGML